ncbi:MAG: leucine-rich repeat domain-containing protein [Alistipes sp.]|nr:leucine-rich repeat domain-containing protein [Alistipes sp.]
MRNLFKLALLSLILMIGCSKENELPTQTQESTKFYASIEVSDTRTYADENGKLLWTADDKITVFKGNTYARQYRYTGQTGLNSGEFNDLTDPSSVITGNALSANYAVYPYDGSTSITNEGVINYTIPATQNYAINSFGLGANTMVAVTKNIDDNFLAFKNIGGYFEFSLYGDDVTVRSIEFKGNNNEKLAGAVTITATNGGEPTVAFSNEATKTITLDCGASGIALGTNVANATKFWFVVPAITYSKGITITITDTEGKEMTKSTSKLITINRSTVQPLDAFLVETENNIPNNKIYYTTTDGNVITPYSKSFGATITSNVYENGNGVITFDGNVTKISSFKDCTTLLTITIPESVTNIGGYSFDGCVNLKDINMPNGLTTIEEGAFYDCTSLSEISIPSSVNTIKYDAFNGCTNLNNILFPNSVTTMGAGILCGCENLISVKLPENITAIGNTFFQDCTSLTEITIPSKVSSIGYYAFKNCTNLSCIYCKNETPPTLENNVFQQSNAISKINVPTTYVETYKATNGWKDYADKIEGYTF